MSIGASPLHVPGSAVSVPPSMPVPLGAAGWVVLTGGAGSVAAVGAETAVSSPAALVAVTSTRIAWPTSVPVRS